MSGAVVPRASSWPLAIAAAAAGMVLGGTVLLWAHYGTAVFFETIRTGFTACFG